MSSVVRSRGRMAGPINRAGEPRPAYRFEPAPRDEPSFDAYPMTPAAAMDRPGSAAYQERMLDEANRAHARAGRPGLVDLGAVARAPLAAAAGLLGGLAMAVLLVVVLADLAARADLEALAPLTALATPGADVARALAEQAATHLNDPRALSLPIWSASTLLVALFALGVALPGAMRGLGRRPALSGGGLCGVVVRRGAGLSPLTGAFLSCAFYLTLLEPQELSAPFEGVAAVWGLLGVFAWTGVAPFIGILRRSAAYRAGAVTSAAAMAALAISAPLL